MKKKDYLWGMPVMIMAAVLFSIGLVSCSGDDDEVGGSHKSVTPGLFNGARITSVDRISYTYSTEGKLKSASDVFYTYNFSEDMKTIERPKTANTSKDNSATYYLTYNKDGYVSTLKYEYPYKSYYGYTATFKYDKNGCLTEIDGGENIKLEWKDECIMAGGVNYGGTVGKGYTNIYTFYYIAGNNKNVMRQYSIETAKMLYEEIYIILAHLGLLGKGPAYLPDDYVSYVNENNEWEGRDSHTPEAGLIQYTFNSVTGLLETEIYTRSNQTSYFKYEWWK